MLPRLGSDPEAFPDTGRALSEPNGLLCVGGDLSARRLLAAYRRGIFPWFGDGTPPLWWAPDPRAVFELAELRLPRRLRRGLAAFAGHVLAADDDFPAVIAACADRADEQSAWLTPAVQRAYCHLHELGHAHALSLRDRTGRLVGGIYGVAIGQAFFAESMFSRVSNASKLALVALARFLAEQGLAWLDAQVINPHTESLGAREWPRTRFEAELAQALASQPPLPVGNWQRRFGDRKADDPGTYAASHERRLDG